MDNKEIAPFVCIHGGCENPVQCHFDTDDVNVIITKENFPLRAFLVHDKEGKRILFCSANDDRWKEFECDKYSEGTIFEM
jgi:hypothetical protein